MGIYNAYLEGAEREAAIINMELNNQYDKLSMLYEMSLMELEQVKKDIELKVFSESGTYDDYEYLISEAEAQAAQDQTNIISEILNWFSGIIQKIANGISNFFKSSNNVPDNTPVEAPEDFLDKETDKKASNIMDVLNSIDEKSAPGFFTSKIGQILGVGVAAASIFVINRAAKKRKATAGEVKEEVKAANETQSKLNGIVGKIGNILNTGKNAPFIGNFCAAAKDALDNLARPVSEWLQEKVNIGNEILNNVPIAQKAADAVNDGIDKVSNAVNNAVNNNQQGGNQAATNNNAAGQNNTQQNNAAPQNVSVTGHSHRNGKATVSFKLSNGGELKYDVNKGAILSKPKNVDDNTANNIITSQKGVIDTIKAELEKLKQQNVANNAPKNNTQQNNGAPQNNTTPPAGKESADSFTIGDLIFESAGDDDWNITYNRVIDIEEATNYISTTQSIFGMIAEEEANDDPELLELQELFAGL